MRVIVRRILLVVAYAALVWPLAEVLQHRSNNAVILQRYSPSYFVWVLFYVLFFVAWTGVTTLAFFRWEQLESLLDRIGQDRVKSWVLWIALPLLWIPLLAFVLVVKQTASPATPHTAAVPLALLLTASLFIVIRLAASTVSRSKLGDLPLLARLVDTSVSQHVDAAAKWLSEGWRSTFTALVMITLTGAAIFAPAFLNPDKLLTGSDLHGLYYELEQYTTSVLRTGRLPLWNPYLFSGMPLLSHPVAIVFYPIQFALRLVLPVNVAIAGGLAIHVWIAGVGMYALCRYLKLSPWIALICALAFMLNGGMLTRIFAGHVWLVYALAWLPTAWLFLMLTLERGSLLALVGSGLVIGLVFLSGHPTFPGYILLFLGVYWLFHAANLWQAKRSLKLIFIAGIRFGAILALAVGFAMIQLLPSAVLFSQASLSVGYDLASANLGALLPHHLAMIFLPDAYPYPGQSIWEQFPYLGVLLPLAAPWAYARQRHHQMAVFLGLVAAFSVVLAFGHDLRLFSMLHWAFPPFRILRVPPRALIMWIPSVILLGGIGLQALADRTTQESWVAWGSHLYRYATLIPIGVLLGYLLTLVSSIGVQTQPGVISALATAVILGIALLFFQLKAGAPLYPQLSRFQGGLAAAALLAISSAIGLVLLPNAILDGTALSGIVLGFVKLAVLLLAISALLPALHRFRGTAIVALLVLLVALADLYTFGAKYISVSDPPSLDAAERQALQVIPQPPQGRFMRGDTCCPNKLMSLGISNIDGYFSGMLTGYAAYLRGVSTNPPLDTVVLLSNTAYPDIDERALDFLNVTHVFSREPLDEPGRELAAEVPDQYFIYRNPDTLPWAFWVGSVQTVRGTDEALQAVLEPDFDYRSMVVLEEPIPAEGGAVSNAEVEIIGYDGASGGLVIQTHSLRAGALVLSEPYYSERRAWIDGQEAPLLRANVGFSAVALPAGSHEVRIGYVPDSLYWGAAITLGTCVLALGLIVHNILRKSQTAKPQV